MQLVVSEYLIWWVLANLYIGHGRGQHQFPLVNKKCHVFYLFTTLD